MGPGGGQPSADGGSDRLTAERIARNEAIFRDANEGVRRAAAEYGVETRHLPFICECADPRCTHVALLDIAEYERIRSNPRWFMNVPGHEVAAQGYAQVVEQYADYFIVEKIGAAGEIVEKLAYSPSQDAQAS
jgi:hypothetical protein